MLCAPGRCLNRFDVFLSTNCLFLPLHPRPRWKPDFHIWSRLRGNGDHTPDPDLESFKNRLRDSLSQGARATLWVALWPDSVKSLKTSDFISDPQARPSPRPEGGRRSARPTPARGVAASRVQHFRQKNGQNYHFFLLTHIIVRGKGSLWQVSGAPKYFGGGVKKGQIFPQTHTSLPNKLSESWTDLRVRVQ
jgi:hypothetical protein